jgi:hypothetical protein
MLMYSWYQAGGSFDCTHLSRNTLDFVISREDNGRKNQVGVMETFACSNQR